MRYINTTPTQLIAEHPRGLYRVVILRRPYGAGDDQTVFTSWPSIVRAVLENSANAAGFPLTPDGTVSKEDTTAVIDYRAATHPGSLKVSDLVNAISQSNDAIEVQSVERMPPVPALSQGGADALNASREAAQNTVQQAADEAPGFLDRFATAAVGAATGLRTIFVAGAVVALVVAAIYFVPRPKGGS